MKTVNDNKSYPQAGHGRFKNIGTSIAVIFFLAIAFASCKKTELNEMDEYGNPAALSATEENGTPESAAARAIFGQVNLVADMDGYDAGRIDRNLKNAWGMDFGTDGSIWIAANMHGSALIYTADGGEARPAVSIGDATAGGGPVGVLSNRTAELKVPATGRESQFLFTSQDGKIIARSFGVNYVVVDRSASGAMYTGIDVASVDGRIYLYATDFANGRVDAFDGSFTYKSTFRFTDLNMATGYKPYNVKTIGNRLWVTYAKQKEGALAIAERGAGYINIFDGQGHFVRRFASGGALNVPWGIEVSNNHIFVANHGDGRINVYDLSGRLMGPIHMNGRPVTISGLWSIGHAKGSADQTYMYFTASPTTDDGRPHGLFGYLKRGQI